MTDYHDYNTPAAGAEDWDVPLNENFELIDQDIEIRDLEENRAQYEPKQGAKFLSVDSGAVYLGDGQGWNFLGEIVPEQTGSGGGGGSGAFSAAAVADASTSVQEAHDSLPSQNAGNGPGGMIVVDPSYDPANESLPIRFTSNVLLKGYGVLASWLQFPSNAGSPVFQLDYANNRQYHAVFDNLTIAGGSFGIDIQSCNRFWARNCRIMNQGISNVKFSGTSLWTQWDRCHFRGAGGVGIDMSDAASPNAPNATVFHGGLVQDAGSHGVLARGAQIEFVNFDASQNSGWGLHIGSGANECKGNVMGGYYEGNDQGDITVRDAALNSGGTTVINTRHFNSSGPGVQFFDTTAGVAAFNRGRSMGGPIVEIGPWSSDCAAFYPEDMDQSSMDVRVDPDATRPRVNGLAYEPDLTGPPDPQHYQIGDVVENGDGVLYRMQFDNSWNIVASEPA